ncbi:sodium/solute symporter [Paludisphaera sp.]|uniref:sodium:solute symporter family transporter n=1 Tax=Paludisphaera sp. TaxID=2017432 RepID=UPI00301CA68A
MTSGSLLLAAGAPLISMGPLDVVIIAVYFVVVLGIGFYLKRYVSTGDDFFMAGRKMTAWIAGLSFISANLSSLETMGWSAMAYQYGMLGAHAYWFGAIPAILFLAIVMMPFYYICNTHSVPGYLKLRFGLGTSALAGISFSVLTVLVSGASMFAMAKILNLLLGWDMNVSIWVSSLTVALYVMLGGLVSAVFNEVLQYFLIWFGSLLIPVLGLIDAGGWSGLVEKIHRNVPVIHPTVGNANFTSLWSNLGSFEANPMGVDWIGMVFGLAVAVGFGYWCTDFLQVQRVIVAKDLRAAQNGTIIGAALKMCVPLIVTLPGLLGLAVLLNGDGTPMVLVSEADPRANITHRTYNDVLPLLMGRYLGPGLLGLGVTAMIAGFMSGMAGNASAFATVWTYDVYRALIRRNASDAHYLAMGRICSVLGILMSVGTAYALFYFSNILEFLQVLIFFFIVPLFGVVILGMLWKRATPAGAFTGFLTAILASMAMWAFVHTFPDGHRPAPTAFLDAGAVVSVEKAGEGESEAVTRVTVESGTVRSTNVPIQPDGDAPFLAGDRVLDKEARTPAQVATKGGPEPTRLIAPDVTLAGTNRPDRFGAEGVEVVLKPGVRVVASDVTQAFNPAEFNPAHSKYVARSEKAKPMAVNVYTAMWTLLICMSVIVAVSLFTRPKPESELRNLVLGLTPMPDRGPVAWYHSPKFWASVVAIALVGLNILFW